MTRLGQGLLVLAVTTGAAGGRAAAAETSKAENGSVLRKAITLDATKRLQRIDGFGVNLTPAQWRGGGLKPTLDRLVDDLGTSLVRLDCYGKADWLDPARRGADGTWPDAYLAQVYRFVRPGWRRVEIALPPRDAKDVYAAWHDPMRHLRLLAFASPDARDVTLVGMSRLEGDVALDVALRGLAPEAVGKPLACYRTTWAEDARLVEEKEAIDGTARLMVPEASIFTLTTLRDGPSAR